MVEAIMAKGYDKLSLDYGMVLDLRFDEGSGLITRDKAKPHHEVDLVGPPAWVQTPNNVTVLDFDGATNYLECPEAETLDLDFTDDDYSIACWVNWEDTGIAGEIVVGRYDLDVAHSGWELYLAWNGAVNSLTLRHHHAGTLVPPITGNPRSACYSVGWTRGVWCLLMVSRTGGGEAIHYRNGVALTMVTGGLVDPETCSEDLVVGVRYTKNATWYKGKMWGLRVWNRALSLFDAQLMFEMESHLFEV